MEYNLENDIEHDELIGTGSINFTLKVKCCIGVIICLILLGFYLMLCSYKRQAQLQQAIAYNQSHEGTQLQQFRNFFDSSIKPTFGMFIESYNNNPQTRLRFRLSRSEKISPAEMAFVRRIFGTLMQIESSQIYENLKITGNDSSYTINKKNIYMCLTNYFNNTPTDLDVVIFVFLHECSHVACIDDEHSYEFWCIFRFILDVFCNFEGRIYKHLQLCSLNMEDHPIKYCRNMLITYNPLFDTNTFLDFKDVHIYK